MTKIDIFSGFLGAGKTTLIKKLIAEAYKGEKLVLIENEFGKIGIDGGFLQEAGIQISEMNSGCICCSLVGDFGKALQQVLTEYAPDRILIEPSGVGKLSDVVQAVKNAVDEQVELSAMVTVADANKCKMYMKNFGEFYNDQIQTAKTIILSRTQNMSEEKLHDCVERLRTLNEHATVITTPWDELTGEQILSAMAGEHSLHDEMESLHEEHHHHHHEDGHCCCGHHHHEHDQEHCHHDHDHEQCHHDHEEHEHHCCGHHEHEHHHHEDGHCCCGHDHEHHHHHADEVFTSWGKETPKKFTEEELRHILHELEHGECGMVLRAKGIVPASDGAWLHFDYVPGETDLRRGGSAVTGRICVIGSHMDEDKISQLFGV